MRIIVFVFFYFKGFTFFFKLNGDLYVGWPILRRRFVFLGIVLHVHAGKVSHLFHEAALLVHERETDLYFRVADNAAELAVLARAELKPIPSIWGHRAGNPVVNATDTAFIKDAKVMP